MILKRFRVPIWWHIGRHICEPERLQIGCNVVVFEKENKNWWERGWICVDNNGKKAINCMDGIYELNEVEVYLDRSYR